MDEKKDGGRVVYSRPEADGGGAPRPSVLLRKVAAGGPYDSLWQTLVPLLVESGTGDNCMDVKK